MKKLFTCLLGLFAIISLSSCANGKKLQEEAPVAFQQAYYVTHQAQDDSNDIRINLYIPAEDFRGAKIQLDSVYFRGRKAELLKSEVQEGLYVSYFELPGKDPHFVMHVDPEKEFGNKVPILEKIPFELKATEAVVVFIRNGKSRYYKLEGIAEKGTGETEIKKPVKVRH